MAPRSAVALLLNAAIAAGQTCDARATRTCPTCPWRVKEPETPGQYTLIRDFASVDSMRSEWACYMGGTGYPAPAYWVDSDGDGVNEGQSGQMNFQHTFGRGYFYEFGPSPVTMEDIIGPNPRPIPWIVDPTAGMNSYEKGCVYKSDLLTAREDLKPGFSMRTMRPSTLNDEYTANNPGWQSTVDSEIWTLRVESKDIYNGGLFGISVSKLPYGAGAWPAFWMVGSEPNDWATDQPHNKGMGLRNYWPYRGEIDIVEYVNAYTMEDFAHQQRNHVTLHEPPGCYSNRSSPSGRGDLSLGGDDCNAGSAFTGCSISMPPKTTGSPDFEGGIYLCDWIKLSHVDCWFFRKNLTGVPSPPPPPAAGSTTQTIVEFVVVFDQNSAAWGNGDVLVHWSGGWAATYSSNSPPLPPPPPGFPPVGLWFATGPHTYLCNWANNADTQSIEYNDLSLRISDEDGATYNINSIAGQSNWAYIPPHSLEIHLTMDSLSAMKVGVHSAIPSVDDGIDMRVALKWEKGLRLISNPKIQIFNGDVEMCTMEDYGSLLTSPPPPSPPPPHDFRPLCGPANQVSMANGDLCTAHVQWLIDNQFKSASEAEAIIAGEHTDCAGCTAPMPSASPNPPNPPPPPFVAASYVTSLTDPGTSGTFQLTLSGGLDYWSGYGVSLNAAAGVSDFAWTAVEGRRKTYQINASLAATSPLNTAALNYSTELSSISYEPDPGVEKGEYHIKVVIRVLPCSGNGRLCGIPAGDGIYAMIKNGDGSYSQKVLLRQVDAYPPPPPPWLGVEAQNVPQYRRLEGVDDHQHDHHETDEQALDRVFGATKGVKEEETRIRREQGKRKQKAFPEWTHNIRMGPYGPGGGRFNPEKGALDQPAHPAHSPDAHAAHIAHAERRKLASAPSGPTPYPVYEGYLGAVYPEYVAPPLPKGGTLKVVICLNALSDLVNGNCRENLNQLLNIDPFDVPFPVSGNGTQVLNLELVPTSDPYKGATLQMDDGTVQDAESPPPPPPPPPPEYAPNLQNPIEPFNITAATEINVADLGPPDVRHELKSGCDMYNSLADMRLILNTVVCGQWAGNIVGTAVPGDPDGFSYKPEYQVPFATPECEAAFRQYVSGKPKRGGNRDYLHPRWDWDIDWIRVWT